MGLGIRKYFNIEDMYAILGEKAYYVDPVIICSIVVDELDLKMSYNEIKKFVNEAKITITQEEINDYLKKEKEEINDNYYADLYFLRYYKNYISILKEKCNIIFEIIDNLMNLNINNEDQKKLKRLLDINLHIDNYGNIYYEDAEKIINFLIMNIKKIYNKVNMGNDPKIYLNLKKSYNKIIEKSQYSSISEKLEIENDILNWMTKSFFYEGKIKIRKLQS